MKKTFGTGAAWLLAFAAFAQTKTPLTIPQMLRNAPTDVTQPLPQFVNWLDDGRFLLRRNGSTVAVDAKTGQESPAPAVQPTPLATGTVISRNNDLFFRAPGVTEDKRLTHTPDVLERNPTLSPDGKFVAFTRKDGNLYVSETSTGKETRLTSDGSETVYNGYAAWVYWEEIFGRPTAYRAFWWSPTGKHLAYMRFDETKVPMFPIYQSSGQHGTLERTRYPKAGDPNPEVVTRVVSLPDFRETTVDFDPKADQYFGTPFWTPDGSALWMQWMPRGQDNLKIYAVNPNTGAKTEVYDEKQKTWVDWFEAVEYLKDGKHVILKSDRDGWAHLYLHTLDGKLKNAITTGRFTVKDIELVDEKNGTVYFTARKDNSARTDLYKAKLDGKGLQRLTFGEFTHDVKLSPNGSYFVTTYSNAQTPPKMAVVDKTGKLVREIADAKGVGFATTDFAPTELVRVKTPDGFELPVRITWPTNLDPAKKYPVIFRVYGGPNAGTVADGWQWSGQNQWWAREGLIQVVADHRGSGHFGKEGQAFMHRNLGKWEIADYAEIVKWLRTKPFVDPTKIAITGFSYGGYATCMALTLGADAFTHGVAGGSVTDWALYDSHYTERFMDTPAENPEGYKFGSVMTHADKYRGLLRLVHGTADDNVHLQNTLQLVDRFQDLGKHFELMLYPGGRHGWSGPKWQHFQTETNRFIYEHLLGRPLPKEMQ